MNVSIHVGLPKTGTTAFQENILPYLDVNPVVHNLNLRMMHLDFHRMNVISHEQICHGLPHGHGNREKALDTLHTLKQCFPDAAIIYSTRDPEQWLYSCYSHAVRSGIYNKDFNHYKQQYHCDKVVDFFKHEYLDMLYELFDDVFLFTQEELLASPWDIVRDLCCFLDVPIPDIPLQVLNRQMNISVDHLTLRRILNKVTPVNISYMVSLIQEEIQKKKTWMLKQK